MSNTISRTTPQYLRALVLDYLCHQSYTDTARAFAQDNATRYLDNNEDDEMSSADDGDLSVSRLRREIKIHILSGRIEEARHMLNTHFPSVLEETSDDPTPPPSDNSQIHFTSQTSVKPIHLSLNLNILAFTESSRTVPLEYPPSREGPKSHLRSIDDPDVHTRHQTALLHRAQKLYSEVSSLENPKDREIYRKEAINVGGLLAYREPEHSPMAKYLSQERRDAVADQINNAILFRSGLPAISRLELCTRYTTALWSLLNDQQVKVPPPSSRPSGVSFPPSSNHISPKASATSEKETEVVPRFDLRQHLDS